MTNSTITAAPHAEDTHEGKRHINPVWVFVILTIGTILEIGITLIHLPREILIPSLLAMSFSKAALVAGYYMHLRYEKLVYTLIFITPAIFAVFLIFVLAASY